LDDFTNKPLELGGIVATAGGNRAVRPRHDRPCHRPLKAKTRVRIPLEPPSQSIGLVILRFAGAKDEADQRGMLRP
jgi:hypothetical protein